MPFHTTQWSQVLRARDAGDEAPGREALEGLCRTYWPPLYAYVRSRGENPEDAQDLTQAFFAELFEKDVLQIIDPSKGRFRSFLLAAMQNFLSHQWARDHTQKRGGEMRFVPLDLSGAEDRLRAVVRDGDDPAAVFEREWALAVMESAMNHLRAEIVEKRSLDVFEAARGILTGAPAGTRYREIAERAGISEGALKTMVYRFRKRYGELLREEVRRTVADASRVDEEVRHLLHVVRAGS